MGLLSGIIKGVGRAVQTIRDLPGKLSRWDLSRDIGKKLKKAEKQTEQISPDINAELEALRKKTEELQRLNDMYRQAIADGGKYGNAKASDDAAKLKNQQRIADAIDQKRENSGALPGTQEWEEARARALEEEGINDYGDSDPPVFDPETDLTEEDREAYYALQAGTPI